jgi:hypothetical protein
LDAVVHEQRKRQTELVAVERPLGLADRDRIEAALRVSPGGQDSVGLGSALPGNRARQSDIEEVGHNGSCTRFDQGPSTSQLPIT